jgi:hypothetical protein
MLTVMTRNPGGEISTRDDQLRRTVCFKFATQDIRNMVITGLQQLMALPPGVDLGSSLAASSFSSSMSLSEPPIPPITTALYDGERKESET